MEKVSYKLLKKLYKENEMDIDSIDNFTKQLNGNKSDQYTSYLRSEKLISSFSVGAKATVEGGFVDGIEHWKITLTGRDYIEKKRKEFLMFLLPYGITTLIAIASLVTTVVSVLHQCPCLLS